MKAFVGFAGFGGTDIALRECGFDVIGVEVDSLIAQVNQDNGGNVIIADILDVNPACYTGYDLMHFSPPCPNFSNAKSGRIETETDLNLSRKICRFIRTGQPEYFTLENVWGYRKSLSWLLIWYTLLEEGYGVGGWNLNAADYGVPQSRRRMIVIARRDGRQPARPWPTHSREPDMFTQPWVGWYEAIEDLIPDLPDTEFAPWQLDRMPEELKTCLLNNNSGVSNHILVRKSNFPSFTVVSSLGSKGAMPRAFLAPVNGEGSIGFVSGSPAPTIAAGHGSSKYRAFIINSQNASEKRNLTIRSDNQPIFTQTANCIEKNSPPKAFIVGGQYQTPHNGKPRTVQNRSGDSPDWTITASENGDTRACCQGRTVSMTPRALARFQDFPDWFVLPEDKALACRGIGNALPPGIYRAVLHSLGLN